jgi:hypothetical protein
MEWSLRKESLSIVAAAGPSTAAESAGAAADNTDQDDRIPAAGLNSLHRRRRYHHHTDSRRTASKTKNGMGSEGNGKGRAKRRDGEKKRVGLKIGFVRRRKQEQEHGRDVIAFLSAFSIDSARLNPR